MNERLPPEIQEWRKQLERENPAAAAELTRQSRLATGIIHPEMLTPAERIELDRIRRDDSNAFLELENILRRTAELSPPLRPNCSRWVPFAHAVLGIVLCILIAWLGPNSRWVSYLAALPLLWGLWSLKSALFDSQATLDRKLYGDD